MFWVQCVVFLMFSLLDGTHSNKITFNNNGTTAARQCKQYMDLGKESLSILPPYNDTIGHAARVVLERHNITRTQLPSQYSGMFAQDNQRASCPWIYVKNIDHNRCPPVMYEAKCSSASCRCVQVREGQRRRPRCQPIYHYVEVLRRVPGSEDENEYTEVLEPLVSGCACLLPTGLSCSSSYGGPVTHEK